MPDPEKPQPKRLRVKADAYNSWAFICPLCKKSFGNNLLFDHIVDHRYGRLGYEQADVGVEVSMIVPVGADA